MLYSTSTIFSYLLFFVAWTSTFAYYMDVPALLYVFLADAEGREPMTIALKADVLRYNYRSEVINATSTSPAAYSSKVEPSVQQLNYTSTYASSTSASVHSSKLSQQIRSNYNSLDIPSLMPKIIVNMNPSPSLFPSQVPYQGASQYDYFSNESLAVETDYAVNMHQLVQFAKLRNALFQ